MSKKCSVSKWVHNTVLLVLAVLTSTGAHAGGIATISIPAIGTEPELQAMIWSPCAKAPAAIQMGPFTLQGVSNCEVSGNALPLIVISHGKGGSMIGHHDTATALANAGFVVASLSHPGDSFGDQAATENLAVFESRPRDMSRLISYMTKDWPQRQRLNPEAIGVFGFSRGGFTALSLIGAVPNVAASAQRFCGPWWSFVIGMCRQLKSDGMKVRSMPDARIRAAVVVDPLDMFDAASFKNVRVPVQLWASELGGDGVELAHIQQIKAQLPQKPEFQVARGAGHFAYLAPCPGALMKVAKEICEDPKGFDRAAWHKKMNVDVTAFFQKNLPLTAKATERNR
jgi:predicted dienelactone hydrolase